MIDRKQNMEGKIQLTKDQRIQDKALVVRFWRWARSVWEGLACSQVVPARFLAG